jgi:serine/threonine protein kinase
VLFDFGLAKLWQTSCDEPADAPRQLTGQTGSARYMAPEVARSRPYGTSAEVYSFGILLWQLASHERPFAGMDMQRHARQVGLAAAWCVVLVANTPPPLLRPILLNYYDLLLRQLLLLLLLLLLAGGRRWAAASAQEGMATAAVRAARGLLARAARAPPWHAGGVRPPAQAA